MTEISDLTPGGAKLRAQAKAHVCNRLVANGWNRKRAEDATVGLDFGDGSDQTLARIVSRLLLPELKRRLIAERAAQADPLEELDKRQAQRDELAVRMERLRRN